MKSLLIFTDGACSGNPGPGGWGAVIAFPEGKIKEIAGRSDYTTNNEMELVATIEALKLVAKVSLPVVFYTDSTYIIRGITQWVWGWMKRGWVTAEGNPVSNKEQWQALIKVTQARAADAKVAWHYSRGHVGTPGNERCDVIAVAGSQKKWIDLYEGSLLQYPIAIYDLPEDSSLPEMKPKQEKKVAFSYLSKIGSVVCRHKDWGSCERRVKGQSGALFKKAMSQSEESEILKAWGLSPDLEIKDV